MTENSIADDIGIRFGAQDVQWLLSSIELMLATSMATGGSKEARERMERYRDELALQSAIPPHADSYGDAFRYSDALSAVRECDAWEARLTVDRKSFFKDCQLSIETWKDGKRKPFKLTSELRLGHDSESHPLEKYGVYLNRLIDVCAEVAPKNSMQLEEGNLRVVADWRAFLQKDEKEAMRAVGALVLEGVVADEIPGPFVIRSANLARWTVSDSEALPERLQYLDVAISATAAGHARLAQFVAERNDVLIDEARAARPHPLA
jgi:hypothetical protein